MLGSPGLLMESSLIMAGILTMSLHNPRVVAMNCRTSDHYIGRIMQEKRTAIYPVLSLPMATRMLERVDQSAFVLIPSNFADGDLQ